MTTMRDHYQSEAYRTGTLSESVDGGEMQYGEKLYSFFDNNNNFDGFGKNETTPHVEDTTGAVLSTTQDNKSSVFPAISAKRKNYNMKRSNTIKKKRVPMHTSATVIRILERDEFLNSINSNQRKNVIDYQEQPRTLTKKIATALTKTVSSIFK
jgi:hypothetical protein